MRKVRLGKTGLMVTRVGFGGIPIMRCSREEAVAVLRRALDLGINFIDTANGYGDSEEKIGEAIQGRRGQVILATKPLGRDAETFGKQAEASFQRMRTDYIELYQLHHVSKDRDLEQVLAPGGAYEVLRAMKEEGRIGAIGVTSHYAPVALKAMETGLFETVQIPLNFVGMEPIEEVLPAARRLDMGFIAMKPLGGGLLEDADVALRFLAQYEGVVPIPGIEREQELEEVVRIAEHPRPLTEADHRKMNRIRQELGRVFCHRCEYCQPCPQEIPISMVLNFRSFAKRMPAQRVLNMMQDRMAKARTCTQCRECEDRCPYELPISSLVAEVVAAYDSFLASHQAELEVPKR